MGDEVANRSGMTGIEGGKGGGVGGEFRGEAQGMRGLQSVTVHNYRRIRLDRRIDKEKTKPWGNVRGGDGRESRWEEMCLTVAVDMKALIRGL